MNPVARRNDLVVMKEVMPELLIHDLKEDKVICLNPSSAFVWAKCDGNHSKNQIANEMEKELGVKISEGFIDLTLAKLSSEALLETYFFDTFEIVGF